MRRFTIPLLISLLFAITISADATPTRIADNVPGGAGAPFSYNRAVAFGTDSGIAWSWGGGTLGFEDDLWRYTYATNTWTTTAINDLPTGEHYIDRTESSYANLLVATSDNASGCDTHVYNIDTNTWTTATALAGTDCSSGAVATAASNYYYFMGGDGAVNFLRRLDLSNPTGAWTTGLDFPTPYSVVTPGFLVYDRLLDRLVYFVGNSATDVRSVFYYNIAADNWISLGAIMPCSGTTCPPVMAYWDNALHAVVAVFQQVANDFSPMLVYRMVWDSSTVAHFTLVETWTHTDFDLLNPNASGGANTLPVASVALPDGNTRLLFGSGSSGAATPTTVLNRFWTHEQSPLVFVLPIEDNLEAKIQRAMNGIGLTGTSGLLIFSFVTSAMLLFALFAVKVSFNITLALLGLWNGGLAAVVFLPAWILIVGVIVIGLGGTLVAVRMFSGGGDD